MRQRLNIAFLFVSLSLTWGISFSAPLEKEDARRAVSILDYIARDYQNAVNDQGKITSAAEFEEMTDFVSQVKNYLGETSEVLDLKKQVESKSPPAMIRSLANGIREKLIAENGITTSPSQLPNLVNGKKIYEQTCASCHGITGMAETVAAKNMSPPPSKLADTALLDGLSPFQAYNTITYGVNDTAMASFSSFSEEDRWALASYIFTFNKSGNPVAASAKAKIDWKDALSMNNSAVIARLQALNVPDSDLGHELELVRNFTGFTQEIGATDHMKSALQLSQKLLDQSYNEYKEGNTKEAYNSAVSSYIDGFEKVESILVAKKQEDLMMSVESSFLRYRKALSGSNAEEVNMAYQNASAALTKVEKSFSENNKLGKSSVFVGSFIIIFREGLEAILLISIILSCLAKVGAANLSRWVHVSWISAIVAGVGTWFIASKLISGANRESVEGWIALLACAVLIYVSFWLLSKKDSQKWIEYLTGRLKKKSTVSYLTVFSVAFFAVYREIFETILFMEALKLQSNDGVVWIMSGALAAIALLAVIAQIIFYLGKKLPFNLFFSVSGHMLYILAVIFVGQGMHSLGEAGLLSLTSVSFLTIPSLGVFPYAETLLAQAALLAVYGAAIFFLGAKNTSKS